ncbi:cell division protein FtsZ [Ketogulonicigenium robustum]|nr:cell division protein FtsZ [Ketogulonicigenium robustum]
MNITSLSMPGHDELKPRITVFGVGGAGGNAVNNMIDQQLEGVEFVVANTDAQALVASKAPLKIQIGLKVTEGLGAGARPAVGAAAAEESLEQIIDHLAGSHMCFITAGMGGGTGTGAAPIIAQAAREMGVLTVGVVTKPFMFEGSKRMRQAEEGVAALQKVVDTLIIIPNQNLFRIASEKTTFTEAFMMADDVLYQGVKGVTDLMVRPGLINLDFADVRSVMDEMGKAMMGTGEADGPTRAIDAAKKAISNPLLDEISLNGARGVLINITGGHDMTLFELDEAANHIREVVDSEANIIVGSTLDPDMAGKIRVSVVATGIDAGEKPVEVPVPRRVMQQPVQPAPEPAFRPEPPREPVQQHRQEYAPQPAPSVQQEPMMERPRQNYAPQPRPTAETYEDVPPMYTPRASQPQMTQPVAPAQQPDPRYVAPQRPASSAAEALQRLSSAVDHSPVADQRPARAPEPQGRFGIGNIIGRMAGHQDGHAPAPQARPQPTAQRDDAGTDAERDRVEIPAFLRRQAN